MRYLIDTHCFLWHFAEPNRLSREAAAAMLDESSDLSLSAASVWELIIKDKIGKLPLPEPVNEFVDRRVALLGCDVLNINRDHLRTLASLPLHHRDPFDRMLVAQALSENLVIVTSDAAMERYGVPILWAG